MDELKSLSEIFSKRIFKIPDYQRGYAWQMPQLEDFWEDLLNLGGSRQHYTGMLTIKGARYENEPSKWENESWLINDRKPFYVVDGQQRLTTAIILINEIVNRARELDKDAGDDDIILGSQRISEIVKDYLKQEHPANSSKSVYIFGYETDNPSFEYMQHKILSDNPEQLEETLYTNNLMRAKKFFKKRLKDYDKNQLKALFDDLTQRLKFNEYKISDDFDIFVAFETMNNRGKKLSYLELLKNRLIYLTTLFDSEVASDDDKSVLRKDINNAWKEIYKQLGSSKNISLEDDDFLREHWIIHFGYSRSKGDSFSSFLLTQFFIPKRVFDGELKPKDITDYVASIKKAAFLWCSTQNPYRDDFVIADIEEKNLIDKLNRIGIAYFRPLVVSVYMLGNSVTREERTSLLREIERFIMLAFRVGRAITSYRNSEFYNFAHKLFGGDRNVNIDAVIKTLRENLNFVVDENGNLISDGFRVYLKETLFRNYEGYYSWNGIRYLLYEYEEYLREKGGNTSNTEQKINWRDFNESKRDTTTIEHIMPQTPSNEYWQSFFGGFEKIQLKALNGSIGNLVGLSWHKNSQYQNDAFPDKVTGKDGKTGYDNGSYSTINVARMANEKFDGNWTPEAIRFRGQEMLEFMAKRWDFKFINKEDRDELLFLDFLDVPAAELEP